MDNSSRRLSEATRLQRGRTESSSPDPDLETPPTFGDSSDGSSEDGDFQATEDEEDDEDYEPVRIAKTSTSKRHSGASTNNGKKSASSTSNQRPTPKVRISETFYNPRLAPKPSSRVKDEEHETKPRFEYRLTEADHADIAAGSVELRKRLTQAFDGVFAAHRTVANLAQDELGRLIIWLSSIRPPGDGTKVKYDWLESYQQHLHGAPGSLLLHKEFCEAALETLGWDLVWEKHTLHHLSVQQRTQLVCCLMSMYLERREPGGRDFVRVRSTPETDWEVACVRQSATLEHVYYKVKSIITRLGNLSKPEVKKGKPKTPLSKEYVVSDDDEDADDDDGNDGKDREDVVEVQAVGDDEGSDGGPREGSWPPRTLTKSTKEAHDSDAEEMEITNVEMVGGKTGRGKESSRGHRTSSPSGRHGLTADIARMTGAAADKRRDSIVMGR